MAAVAATRADPIATKVIQHASDAQIRQHLDSPQVLGAALSLAGLHPNDDEAALTLVRIISSFIQNPIANTRLERTVIERFAKPAFENYDYSAAGDADRLSDHS